VMPQAPPTRMLPRQRPRALPAPRAARPIPTRVRRTATPPRSAVTPPQGASQRPRRPRLSPPVRPKLASASPRLARRRPAPAPTGAPVPSASTSTSASATAAPKPDTTGSAAGTSRGVAPTLAAQPSAEPTPTPAAHGRSPPPPVSTDGLVTQLVSRVPPWMWLLVLVSVCSAAALSCAMLRGRRRTREARRVALADPLTGVANRLAFEHQLAVDWQRMKRYGETLGVLVIDLDNFKAINDSRGHAACDRLLRETAAALTGCARQSDLVARVGGDEFVMLTTHHDSAGLETLAKRVRRAVTAAGGRASVGWAQAAEHDTRPDDVVNRADIAMYAEKPEPRPAAAALPATSLPAT
jgi:diguanylate cyclase (GGDEF)-like protein